MMPILKSLVASVLPIFVAAVCVGNITQSTYDGLFDFFNSLNGKEWRWDRYAVKWIFPSSLSAPCADRSWFGLDCDYSSNILEINDCDIVGIVLNSMNLSGTLPSSLNQLGDLRDLELVLNQISGTVPSEIGNLTYLTDLQLEQNVLSGTIPSELGFLSKLEFLSFGKNMLSGPLPSQLSNLKRIAELYLDENSLTGLFPSALFLISSLNTFDLSTNMVTGEVHLDVANNSGLSDFSSENNFLSGTLPVELGKILSLTQVVLSSCYLTGTLPWQYGVLSKVTVFEVEQNLLTSSIPREFANLTSLEELSLSENVFEGTLAVDFFERMHSLTTVFLEYNYLTGSVPSLFSESIETLALYGNSFSGSISPRFGELTALITLLMQNNHLSGPMFVIDLKHVQSVSVADNFLSGPVPEVSGPVIAEISLNENYFSGLLPLNMSGNINMEGLDISFNFVSGTVPTSWLSMQKMNVFNMTLNLLSGNISGLFSSTLDFPKLSVIDFSENEFTGDIPSKLFHVNSSLTEVILHNNCFRGTLPDSICESMSLLTLILDGASSANACREKYGPALAPIIKVVIGTDPLSGTIPSCIWSMTSLLALHLSGNDFDGSLGDISNNSTLNDVNLGNNRLVGSIPSSWQTYGKFIQLDLSSNKLDGTLSASFLSNSSTMLDLSVNRLSGQIPASFKHDSNINILNGNLFDCDASSIPDSDPNAKTYVCGSDDLNYSLLAWFIGLCVCVLIICFERDKVAALWKDLISCESKCWNLLDSRLGLTVTASGVGGATLFSVCISLPCYAMLKAAGALSVYYSTHTFQYAWTVSVIYLHGIAPTILVIIQLLVMLASFLVMASFFRSRTTVDSKHTIESSVALSLASGLNVAVIIVAHVVVTVIVNVAYVVSLISGLPASLLLVVQLGLSGFKLSWNRVFVTFAVRHAKLTTERSYIVTIFMSLFTFLGSPLVATLFSDPSCFRYIITRQPTVTSQFDVGQVICDTSCLEDGCVEVCFFGSNSVEVYTTVQPAWQYSYECSSSLVVDYVPVLVFAMTISGLVVPAAHAILAYATPNDRFANSSDVFSLPILVTMRWSKKSTVQADSVLIPQRNEIVNSMDMISKLTLNVAIGLTFGLACPLLMATVLVDTLATVALMLSLIARYDQLNSSDVAVWPSATEICNEAPNNFPLAGLQMAAGIAAIFWSFFVFDMMGDVYGSATGGYFVLATCAAVVIVVTLASGRYFWSFASITDSVAEGKQVRESELSIREKSISTITRGGISADKYEQSLNDRWL